VPGLTTRLHKNVLCLLKGTDAAAYAETWIDLFTASPTTEVYETLLSGQQAGTAWGAGRRRVYADSAQGSPFWSEPRIVTQATVGQALDGNVTTEISNLGSLLFNNISLTASPSTIVSFGIYAGQTGNAMLGWGVFDTPFVVSDGENIVLAPHVLTVKVD